MIRGHVVATRHPSPGDLLGTDHLYWTAEVLQWTPESGEDSAGILLADRDFAHTEEGRLEALEWVHLATMAKRLDFADSMLIRPWRLDGRDVPRLFAVCPSCGKAGTVAVMSWIRRRNAMSPPGADHPSTLYARVAHRGIRALSTLKPTDCHRVWEVEVPLGPALTRPHKRRNIA